MNSCFLTVSGLLFGLAQRGISIESDKAFERNARIDAFQLHESGDDGGVERLSKLSQGGLNLIRL